MFRSLIKDVTNSIFNDRKEELIGKSLIHNKLKEYRAKAKFVKYH